MLAPNQEQFSSFDARSDGKIFFCGIGKFSFSYLKLCLNLYFVHYTMAKVHETGTFIESLEETTDPLMRSKFDWKTRDESLCLKSFLMLERTCFEDDLLGFAFPRESLQSMHLTEN